MTLTGDTRFDGSASSYRTLALGAESVDEEKLLTALARFLNTTDRPGRLQRLVEIADGLTAEEEIAKEIPF